MNPFTTPWTKQAVCQVPHASYPRPMMVRRSWINLNGVWNYRITDRRIQPFQFYQEEPFPFDGTIRVPFSPEAPLSGVKRQLKPEEVLWYSRSLILSQDFFLPEKNRLLLHFGAVDQICTVYVNGRHAGYHKGGYLPFTLDISPFLSETDRLSILVSVRDYSDTSYHARGKQKLKRGGMFYTAQSGIWQTVWLESVPREHIKSLRLRPDPQKGIFSLRVLTEGGSRRVEPIRWEVFAPTYLGPEGVLPRHCLRLQSRGTIKAGQLGILTLPAPHSLWTPERPLLYPIRLRWGEDEVYTYAALRSCQVKDSPDGHPRLYLNGAPYFQAGILNQGYWPDGLYTPPSDEAWIYDIRTIKDLGFNMIRMHGKVEADRWYFHCDRMGMLLWQDMVNGGESYRHWFVTYFAILFNSFNLTVKDTCSRHLSRREPHGRQEFIDEVRATIRTLHNHPSIVCWVPFNEGWGQFSTWKVAELIRRLDPSRLVDAASGWFDQGCGDLKSLHYYFFTLRLPKKEKRALAISEYGGYSLRLPGHCTRPSTYGYRTCRSREALTGAVGQLMKETILPSIQAGVSATVYTQLSDIEEEVNGVLTYDRREIKMHPLLLQKWNAAQKRLGNPAPSNLQKKSGS
ncbi:MAG: glycoside hydrolase family 2 TIM barrel-domain containing protein [Eubacteriales bacterium]|nr:glycoside hydrolase family 2 TIM barrel-domain containing protein [Eubacteriales bacterium]